MSRGAPHPVEPSGRSGGRQRRRYLASQIDSASHRLRDRRIPGHCPDVIHRQQDRPFANLGPILQAFGNYLSTRIDLVPEPLRRELKASRPFPETSLSGIREQIERELGKAPDQLFSTIQPAPCESHFLTQGHRATTVEGQEVMIRRIRPEVLEHWSDLNHLSLYRRLIELNRGRAKDAWSRIEMDFRRHLEKAMNFPKTAEILEQRWDKSFDGQSFLTGRPIAHWITPHLLVCEVESAEDEDRKTVPGGRCAEEASHAGKYNIHLTWLHWALLDGPIVTDYLNFSQTRNSVENTLAHGVFTETSPSEREHLRKYFEDVNAHAADLACIPLLELVDGPEESIEPLKRRIRQALPLRDSEPGNRSDTLADELLLHWKILVEEDFQPKDTLLAFYRGIGQLQELDQQQSPDRRDQDLLRDAYLDLQPLFHWERLAQAFYGYRASDPFGQFAQATQAIGTGLTQLAQTGLRLKVDLKEKRKETNSVQALLAPAALLLVLLNIDNRLGSPGVPTEIELLATIFCVALLLKNSQ